VSVIANSVMGRDDSQKRCEVSQKESYLFKFRPINMRIEDIAMMIKVMTEVKRIQMRRMNAVSQLEKHTKKLQGDKRSFFA
jgi:hypothetical protein